MLNQEIATPKSLNPKENCKNLDIKRPNPKLQVLTLTFKYKTPKNQTLKLKPQKDKLQRIVHI